MKSQEFQYTVLPGGNGDYCFGDTWSDHSQERTKASVLAFVGLFYGLYQTRSIR